MYKYISLFIGIIIYLIYNHNETFNVGGKNLLDRCDHVNDPPNVCNISTRDEFCNNPQGRNMCKCSDGSDSEVDRCVLEKVLEEEILCETNSDCKNIGTCGDDKCYCYFNKCKSIDTVSEDLDYNLGTHNVCDAGGDEDTYITMLSNTQHNYLSGDQCILNSECQPSPNESNGRIDLEYNRCIQTYAGQPQKKMDCFDSHSVDRHNNLCFQRCPIKAKTNNSKDLVNAGFEHVQLVDLSDAIDREYHNGLDYKTLSEYKGITVGEYHFYKFLEKKYNSRAKKIKHGIVYINSRIFYYTMADTVRRSTRGSDVTDGMVLRGTKQITNKNNPNFLQAAFPILHVDFTNFEKWRSTWSGEVHSEQWGDSVDKSLTFQNKTQIVINGQMYNPVDIKFGDPNINFAYFPDTDEQLNLYKKLNKKLKHINIWVKLAGSQNLNSLALLDTVEDAKLLGNQFWPIQNWKNALLSQLSTDKNSQKKTRMNQLSDGTGIILNKNNFDMPEYNVDLDNLYTFNMNDGDALVFNTLDTPHAALELKNDEWRLSVETRYAYMNRQFDIFDVFHMDSDSLIANVLYDNNNSLLVNEAQALSEIRPVGTAPTDYSPLIEGYGFFSIDIVKQIFIDQYNLFKMLYNRAYSDLSVDQINPYFVEQFNINLFKYMMDHIRFELLIDVAQVLRDDSLLVNHIKDLIKKDGD